MSALKTAMQILNVLIFALFTTLATAQQRPGYGTAINLAAAKKITAGALAECQKNNWWVAVAIVDNHGFLVNFEKLDDTQTASGRIAIQKAKAAATYRRPTRAFLDAKIRVARQS